MSSDRFALSADLHEIRAQIGYIRSYLEGYDRARFEGDQRTIDAVALRLLYVGEIIKEIQERDKGALEQEVSSTIPWDNIRAMRNRLAHDYDTILSTRIWDVYTDHLDPLERAIDQFHGIDQGGMDI